MFAPKINKYQCRYLRNKNHHHHECPSCQWRIMNRSYLKYQRLEHQFPSGYTTYCWLFFILFQYFFLVKSMTSYWRGVMVSNNIFHKFQVCWYCFAVIKGTLNSSPRQNLYTASHYNVAILLYFFRLAEWEWQMKLGCVVVSCFISSHFFANIRLLVVWCFCALLKQAWHTWQLDCVRVRVHHHFIVEVIIVEVVKCIHSLLFGVNKSKNWNGPYWKNWIQSTTMTLVM